MYQPSHYFHAVRKLTRCTYVESTQIILRGASGLSLRLAITSEHGSSAPALPPSTEYNDARISRRQILLNEQITLQNIAGKTALSINKL